ncbi:MAG: hypothetical protein ACLFRX_00575 [Gemmatimonadota bacterium]
MSLLEGTRTALYVLLFFIALQQVEGYVAGRPADPVQPPSSPS